ncbi:thiol peroxidase [Corynebacterium sp. 335C]
MATTAFQGTPVQLSGDLPAAGTAAPEFTLTKTDLSDLSKGDLAGKRVVLNIFPSVDTGVCAASVRRFNELAAGSGDDVVVLNVSRDLPFALDRFCGAEGIENAEAASDFRHGFGDAFGAVQADGPLAGLLARSVVVLDAEGTVAYVQLVDEITTEPDYDAAMAALGELAGGVA